jgi:cell division septation protein DedD
LKKSKLKWDKFISFVPMNKTVEHYISELLFLHDCVILPNFGGFVGNPQSAKLNKITGILSPPSKNILFNKNLKTNDGLLITHVSNQEGISQSSAKNEVLAFTDRISKKLHLSKILRIEKIGLFTLGKEENIIFLQDSGNNYSLDAFGMKAIHNKTISRVNEVEENVIKTIKNIRIQNRDPKVFLKAAAVIIPLIALSYLSISEQDRINNVYAQMATLNPFTTNEIAEKAIEPTPKKEIELIKSSKIIEIPIAEEVVAPIIKQQHTFYIIAGAFSKKRNATRLQAKLNDLKYKSEILSKGRLLKVSYDSFNNREDAVLALNKIRQINPSAWILTK